MNEIKYYLCIKEIEETITDTTINDFIRYSFGDDKMRGRYYDNFYYNVSENYYNYRDNIPPRYDFTKGRIYSTSLNGEYIMDGSRNTHKLLGLKDYFLPFEFEIDPQVKRIIEAKKLKGDIITVEPFAYNLTSKVTVYNIQCTIVTNMFKYSRQTYQTFDYSQLEGIIHCYAQLRGFAKSKLKLEDMLHGCYYKKRLKRY